MWDELSLRLPPGSAWHADCSLHPEICRACGVEDAAGGGDVQQPVIKAWTGAHFVPYAGEDLAAHGPMAVVRWLMAYSDWDILPETLNAKAGAAARTTAPVTAADDLMSDNAPALVRGKLQPWTGQALPAQVFLPTVPPPKRNGGLYPMILYFHGGNDGPWGAMNQQALAYQLVHNESYARDFPFVVVMPCTECTRDGHMVPYGNAMYAGGRPNFGECGFTPRNLLRADALLAAALATFRGDPERITLTSTSYGGRGLYWYAASRVRILVRVLRPIGRTCASQLLVARLWPRGVLVGLHFYDAEQARNHLGLLQHRLSRGLHLGLEILHLQRKAEC